MIEWEAACFPFFLEARDTRDSGAIAKRLCTGLQIRRARFDSGSRLHRSSEKASQRCEAFLFVVVVPGAGLEPACLAAADFKSATSTGFVTRASGPSYREPRDPHALEMGAAQQ